MVSANSTFARSEARTCALTRRLCAGRRTKVSAGSCVKYAQSVKFVCTKSSFFRFLHFSRNEKSSTVNGFRVFMISVCRLSISPSTEKSWSLRCKKFNLLHGFVRSSSFNVLIFLKSYKTAGTLSLPAMAPIRQGSAVLISCFISILPSLYVNIPQTSIIQCDFVTEPAIRIAVYYKKIITKENHHVNKKNASQKSCCRLQYLCRLRVLYEGLPQKCHHNP